jgi:hypothetical protein
VRIDAGQLIKFLLISENGKSMSQNGTLNMEICQRISLARADAGFVQVEGRTLAPPAFQPVRFEQGNAT